MIFSELYGAYYHAVAQILKRAVEHPLEKDEIRSIAEKYAFGESAWSIESALTEGRWQLISPDGTTPVKGEPAMPLTLLQKRWLKAIFLDPRIRLFQEEPVELYDVPPLFTPEDIRIFDRYLDGDDYSDETYRANFRLILDAIRHQYPLSIDTENHHKGREGRVRHIVLLPKYLEYSEKDDKFRLLGLGRRHGGTVNLGRIIRCERCTENCEAGFSQRVPPRTRKVIFELIDERNAVERVLLHFAHFEKQAEKLGDGRFKVTVYYDKNDETELVIRILSFGPMVKVTAPAHFRNLIKERLVSQKNCRP